MTTPNVPDQATYMAANPFFDTYANYTIYGTWTFVVPPNGTTGGGGGAWLLGGNSESGTQTLSANGNVLLQSNVGSISLLAPNAGQFAYITASNVSITGSAAVNLLGGAYTVNAASLATTLSGQLSLGATGGILLPSLANVSTANTIYYNVGTGAISYALAPAAFNPASNYSVSGTWLFSNASVSMSALANVVTAQTIYYNSTTGLLTYGAVSSFNQAGTYVLTGSWQFNCPFAVNASSGDVSISSATQNINLLATTAGKTVNIQGDSLNFTATTVATLQAATLFLTGSSTVSITGPTTSITSATVNLTNIPNTVNANVLYFDSTTKRVSWGIAPAAGGITQNNATIASTSMAVNNGYVNNYTGGGAASFVLPVTAAVGQIVQVSGNAASGWQVTQNVGQNIQLGAISTTVGTGGSLASSNRYDCVTLICTVANTTFVSAAVVGNITYV